MELPEVRSYQPKPLPVESKRYAKLPFGRYWEAMATTDSQTEHVSDAEAALLDAELFVKYHAPERAIKCARYPDARRYAGLAQRERSRLSAVFAPSPTMLRRRLK